jgi:hypothetical protein
MPIWDTIQGAPQAASFMPPQIGAQLGQMLGNLPQDYLQGLQQQQQIKQFQLINQILGQQAGGGGVAAQPSGDIYGNAGGAGAGPAVASTGGTDVASLLKGAIYGQESGSGRNTSTSAAGARGPMQIEPATFAANAQPGEDINDPTANKAVGDRILDKYLTKYGGDWRRAATAYYSGEGNVAPPGSPTPWIRDVSPKAGIPGPSTSGYVQQIGARMARNRAQGPQVASTDPNFVPSGQPQAVQTAGGSAPTPQAQPPQQIAQNAPAPAPAAPGGVSAASALVPAQWRNDPKGYADWLGNRANQLRAQADKVESGAKIQAGPIKIEPKAEGLRKAADDADATRTRVLDAIKQEASPTDTEKLMRAQGVGTPAQLEAAKTQATKQTESDVAQYGELHKGLAGAGLAAANGYDYNRQAKALLSDPSFYSGSMEGANLAIKRFLSGVGIDPGAALPQEAFRKVMAANIQQQITSLKAETEAMGEKGGRIFAPQIELMERAAQNPDNSIAANRYLTEVATRSADRTLKIADMADDYKKAHGALDAGFEKDIRNWIVKNPLFTPQELANPKSIGAPKDQGQAPQGTGGYSEGATATNPKTGERMIYQKGKWAPLT